MTMKNEAGLTLVEILAALVILGIIFVSFMTIFPKMNHFNERTESKLVTMNLAKQELAELKESPSLLTSERKLKNSTTAEPYETYDFSQADYIVEVDCYDTQPGSKPNYTCSDPAKEPRLHRMHIRVKENGKVTSESFGYLEIR
ncbi:hypothetical protein NCCP2716_29930 [Sporosarcina sp. NCCP-2716]|uniref:type IV pilus modification PilV family protein n=1 Tax=Sporosarcina sp. NCCP-2716 TaxID=2943679 RepID=UPI00203E540D|nr:type II secretion system protein [Sporosarcina sp. NCCP-2716]GKV70495.1 hypothetical protein NCCP2716_29930 [Sporosarcina sp. NCCP-2716]